MMPMSVLAPLLTGVGLFFCGVRFIATNLTPLAGPTARGLFRQAMSADWKAAVTGVIAGLVTQSTNAVSLIVVGFVRAGIIPEQRAVLLPTWSHVGAAALVLVVSMQTNVAVAYVLALAGAALYFDFNLSDRARNAVLALLGAGMLFLGMEMLKVASDPLRAWLLDRGLLVHGQVDPIAPLALGAVMAVVTQSSTVAGAISVALVRVGVFDLTTAMILLIGANAGSALNYMILGRKGEAVGRHILLFQAAQKLFGAALLGAPIAAFGTAVATFIAPVGDSPAMQFAWVFLAVQVGGSLACTVLRAPLSGVLRWVAPPSQSDALAKPAHLVDEALADPLLALDLVVREEQRLIQRLPRMLEHLRSEGDRTVPASEQLKSASLQVGEATRRYLASVLEGEPGRKAVMRAMRLQHAQDNIGAMHEALDDFVRAVRASGSEGALTLGHMVESLHMLLGVLEEIALSQDAEEQAFSLRLLGDREKVIEDLRARLMAASADAPAKVQEALFRSTVLFERVLWLARDTALVFVRPGADGNPAKSPAPELKSAAS